MSIVTAWLIYFDLVIAAGSLGEIGAGIMGDVNDDRSEEHTSELQSLVKLVCRLLLEKKKEKANNDITR